MKKLLLTILLTIFSTSAMAEWRIVDFNDEAKYYFETTSIRKKANIATMWELYDYKNPQKISNTTYLSSKTKYAYDCENESKRILSDISYKGNMGEGKVVRSFDYTDGESTHSAIPPDSVASIFMKIACDIK